MEVQNIQEALEIARRWKAEGRYNWFRGQTHPWPIVSTLGRLSEEQREKARGKLGRFYEWVKATPSLEPIADENSFFAVAQHYGLPTNYIDFTTDPGIAAFFATRGQIPEGGKYGCLYCLNTENIIKFWKTVVPWEYPQIEAIEINVPNLWRIEAQFGAFLYCPCDGLESWYAPDWILFPHTKPVATPTSEEVYPARKSSLEILLDQYFASERSREGSARFRTKAEKLGWVSTTVPPAHDQIDQYIVTGNLNELRSWHPEATGPWLYTEKEAWQEALSEEMWEFEISFGAEPVDLQQELEGLVRRRFTTSDGCRRRLVNWLFRIRDRDTGGRLEEALRQGVQRVWDGMRILPYTYEEIAKSVSAYVALFLLWGRTGKGRHEAYWKQVFGPYLPDGMEVDFGSHEGAGARGVISKSKLLAAVRDDIALIVVPEHRDEFVCDVRMLLQFITSPYKLFEFDRLQKLFVEELIPTQAVMYTADEPIYFTPARLELFGLP